MKHQCRNLPVQKRTRTTPFFSAGFTVVETLMAVAVLLLAITAPMTLAERSLASADAARREVTAFYLAQEGMEFIRNYKDSNALQTGGRSWLNGLAECAGTPGGTNKANEQRGCGIDTTENAARNIETCSDVRNNDCAIYQNTNRGDIDLYGLFGMDRSSSDWVVTDYTRRIFVDEITRNKEARITAIVTWNEGVGARNVRVDSTIFNWYWK
jgi:Tfp pilus assembly protein PilV